MLQLPERHAATKASANAKARGGNPVAMPTLCPVVALLVEYESIIAAHNKIDEGEHSNQALSDLATMQGRLEEIVVQVSNMSPDSFEGAIFQMMLAFGEASSMMNASTGFGRDQAYECFSRLMYRAMDRLTACFNWPATRQYVCPSYCDPRQKGAK